MPFPLSSHGRMRAESADLSHAMKEVEALLRERKASSIAVRNDRIDFTVRFLRLVSNWNLLVPIDSGTVAFTQSDQALEIHYSISFKRSFSIVATMTIVMFGFVAVLAVDPPGAGLAFVVVAWLGVFVVNYFVAVLRFRAALRSSVHAR
jgi:hypothetical protein